MGVLSSAVVIAKVTMELTYATEETYNQTQRESQPVQTSLLGSQKLTALGSPNDTSSASPLTIGWRDGAILPDVLRAGPLEVVGVVGDISPRAARPQNQLGIYRHFVSTTLDVEGRERPYPSSLSVVFDGITP